MDIEFGNPEKNKKVVLGKFKELFTKEKPDIVLLPELWTTGYDLTRIDEIADKNGEEMKAFFADLATRYNVNIIGGSVANKTDDGVKNTLYVIDRKGNLVHEYSKVHLFQLMNEHHHLIAGDGDGSFTLEGMNAAGVICYDIRFPEWIRLHAVNGAEVLFVTAEWPLPRVEHWRSLLISRAIENQSYVVACNRIGEDPNNVFAGHSMVIDPWGKVIAEAGETDTILEAKIDLEEVKKVRKQIPIFTDRLPELYQRFEKKF